MANSGETYETTPQALGGSGRARQSGWKHPKIWIHRRKPVTLAFFAFSLLFTPILFVWTHGLHLLLVFAAAVGLFGSGQMTWMAVWLPELYPRAFELLA
jgi:hypothetical protein